MLIIFIHALPPKPTWRDNHPIHMGFEMNQLNMSKGVTALV